MEVILLIMDIWVIVLTVIVIVTILVMARILQRTREQLLVQLEARDHAQEAHQQEWKEQQEMRQQEWKEQQEMLYQEWKEQQEQCLTKLEERLVAQMHTLLKEVHTKEAQDSRRIDDLKRH